MPGLTEYGKIFRDWEGLLGAVEKRAALLPGADALKAALAGHLTKARDLKLKQEGFDGDKKETTEQLRSAVKEGRDAASMLRAFVKGRIGLRTEVLKEFGVMATRLRSWVRGWYGPHNEKLTEFGVKPIRKRGPRKRALAGAKDEAPRNPQAPSGSS